jgi:hypothetical protein
VADGDVFHLTLLQPREGLAVQRRELGSDGCVIKSDHTLNVKMWRMKTVRGPNESGPIAALLRWLNSKPDIASTHGVTAPGVNSWELNPRWSGEARGSQRTLLDADRASIPIDGDKIPIPAGSDLAAGRNIVALADYFRDEILPPSFRGVELVVRASSSTGFNRDCGSLHAYALLAREVPMPVMYRWLKGAQESGLPVDPRPALPGQLFLSARPQLIGLGDPVPEDLRVFVLPGLRRTVQIDWREFEPHLLVREATERRAHSVGSGQGWRSILDNFLGDGEGRLGFFATLSTTLGYAARTPESADEIVSAMHAIVAAHPDLNDERAGKYTPQWLRRELARLRANDAARAARTDEIRRRLFPTMDFAQ